jgi:hypothetical protein
MMARLRSRGLALVASVPVLAAGTGCYEYRSASIASVRPAETVHIALSPETTVSLASTIGPNATGLDGEVLSVNANTLRLAVTQIARADGPEEFLKNEPIDVPAWGASAITVRSVDRMRTLLALGGLIAGVIVARIATTSPGVITVKGGPSTGTK